MIFLKFYNQFWTSGMARAMRTLSAWLPPSGGLPIRTLSKRAVEGPNDQDI